jgi:hypothetical protein
LRHLLIPRFKGMQLVSPAWYTGTSFRVRMSQDRCFVYLFLEGFHVVF